MTTTGAPSDRLLKLGDRSIRSPKARGLAWLQKRTGRVPAAFVWRGPSAPPEAVFAPLDDGTAWAVRSSSLAEDNLHNANAGRYSTILGVTGAAKLAEAAGKVLQSAAKDQEPSPMDVIFQQMVAPKLAGVVFTRNPLTGLSEVVIEAVESLADALVSGEKTPLRWVWRGEGFTVSPPQTEWNAVVEELARAAAKLAVQFGRPADLEWAYDTKLWWLQIRPITAIAETPVYSNRISREVMPGLIKPMVWSINMPLVNAAWIGLIDEAVGTTGLTPPDLAKQFAFRSYFNMSALGRVFELMGFPYDSLEMLLGLPNTPRPSFRMSRQTLALLPRLLRFGFRLLRYQSELSSDLPEVQSRFDLLGTRTPATLTDSQLVEHIDDLRVTIGKAAVLNILTPVLANLYAGARRRLLRRNGIDEAEVNLAEGIAGLDQFDPNHQLRAIGSLLEQNRPETEVSEALASFIATFGHLSDSGNDISVSPWRETPEQILQLARQAASKPPSVRTRMSLGEARERTRSGRFMFDFLHKRAAALQLGREQVSFAYTYGYGLLRPACLELGRRLVENGSLAEADDVMFLALDEARDLLRTPRRSTELVVGRRRDYASAADALLPETIYGDSFTPLPPGTATTRVSGVGSSRGQHTAPLRIVKSSADFAKVSPGDIVAIPYSDVGWAPLFAVAGGVVAESGGMLSHSSILTRELGIPCIVSAVGAMQLPDGVRVTIDGLAGVVVVHEEEA